MTQSKNSAEITALRTLALKDLNATSDEELRKELIDDGVDIRELSVQVRTKMHEVSAAALRARTALARERMRSAPNPGRLTVAIRPAIERMKQMVQDVFQREPELAVAFRDGKRQSDADIQSLYDDLVSIGAIKPEDDGH